MGHPIHSRKLYGTATVGAKGQVVIPADAREEMGINAGDRLYVVGTPEAKVIALLKEETLEEFVQTLAEQVESLRAAKNKDKETQ